MSVVTSAKNYFLGSYAEMKKVTWPTKKQTVNYSLLVIGMSVGLALFFAGLDYVFNLGLEFLLK
jgi:preprotein translocase subunit SecE